MNGPKTVSHLLVVARGATLPTPAVYFYAPEIRTQFVFAHGEHSPFLCNISLKYLLTSFVKYATFAVWIQKT